LPMSRVAWMPMERNTLAIVAKVKLWPFSIREFTLRSHDPVHLEFFGSF
jgi:hypothetical protein